MSKCPIVAATRNNCISYQQTAADIHLDAVFHISDGAMLAAANAQRHSAEYHQAAWDRLARLIGVE